MGGGSTREVEALGLCLAGCGVGVHGLSRAAAPSAWGIGIPFGWRLPFSERSGLIDGNICSGLLVASHRGAWGFSRA